MNPPIRASTNAPAATAISDHAVIAAGVRRSSGAASGTIPITIATSSETSTRSEPSSWLGTVAPSSGVKCHPAVALAICEIVVGSHGR